MGCRGHVVMRAEVVRIRSSDVASLRMVCVKFIYAPLLVIAECCQQLRGLIPTEGAYSTYCG
jgi:hypothetical protein